MDHNASPEGGFRFMLMVVTAVGLSTWLFFFTLPALLGSAISLQPQIGKERHISSVIPEQHSAQAAIPGL